LDHTQICHKIKLADYAIPQENDPTLKGRVRQSDAREMQAFYRHYYKKYIQALQNASDQTYRSAAALLPSFFLSAAALPVLLC
jgi:hypothetical protein